MRRIRRAASTLFAFIRLHCQQLVAGIIVCSYINYIQYTFPFILFYFRDKCSLNGVSRVICLKYSCTRGIREMRLKSVKFLPMWEICRVFFFSFLLCVRGEVLRTIVKGFVFCQHYAVGSDETGSGHARKKGTWKGYEVGVGIEWKILPCLINGQGCCGSLTPRWKGFRYFPLIYYIRMEKNVRIFVARCRFVFTSDRSMYKLRTPLRQKID